MKITIIAVGKLKESYLKEAVSEYAKRLNRYAKLDIIEVPDEPAGEKISPAEEIAVLAKEGERILKYIKEGAYCIATAISGTPLTSEGLADKIAKLSVTGHSHIYFVIGGSLGLCGNVLKRADFRLSFSQMTFPHQLMRVMLVEQLYRAFRINSNEPYHK